MSLSGATLGLVAASSVGWAALDALRKALGHRMAALTVLAWVATAQGILFTLWAVAVGAGLPDAAYLGPGALILLLNMVSNWMFIRSVSQAPLSQTIPFLSFTPVLTTLWAWPLLGEAPSARQGVGILLVVGGALALNLGRAGRRGLKGAFTFDAAGRLMCGVALFWSVVGPLDKQALAHASLPVHAGAQNLAIAAVFGLLHLARGRGRELRDGWRHRWWVLAAALVGVSALGMQLTAYTMTLVGLVEALKRAIGLVLAVIVGRVAFGEGVTLPKLGAILLMGVGTSLLLL